MVSNWETEQALVDRAQVFSEKIAACLLDRADVQEATLGTSGAVDEVRGGSHEPLSHQETVLVSLDGGKRGGIGTGVPTLAASSSPQ